jgi:hypothetical protein
VLGRLKAADKPTADAKEVMALVYAVFCEENGTPPSVEFSQQITLQISEAYLSHEATYLESRA